MHLDFLLIGFSRNQNLTALNVTADCEVWLYKSGAPGRSLGMISAIGSNEIMAMLREAANEYGALYRAG